MSVELLESIKRQAEALTPAEKSHLGTYRLKRAKDETIPPAMPINKKAAEHERKQHMEWLKANGEAFGGQYVALDGNQLVCTGRTFGEASEAARAAGRPDAFVTYLPKPDEIIETGGWL